MGAATLPGVNVTTQLLGGYVGAVVALLVLWAISHYQIRTTAEDVAEIAEEWREASLVSQALTALAGSPGGRSPAELAADLENAAASEEESGAHALLEQGLFRRIAGYLREYGAAAPAERRDLQRDAHAAAAEFWSEDGPRAERILVSLERRARNVPRLNAAIGSGLLVMPLLFFLFLRRRIISPLQRFRRRIEALGVTPAGALGGAAFAQMVDEMATMIDERQRGLEAEVETRTEQLRHADRLGGLGRMAASIAHEINNPLSSVLVSIDGMRKSLERGTLDPAETRQYLDTVRTAVNRCSATTQRMLTFARYKPESPRRLALGPIVSNALQLVAAQARNAGVTLESEDRAGNTRTYGDGGQLQQVVVNLLLNAIDVSPRGATVRTAIALADGHIVIRVTDDGPGIAPDREDDIFAPFVTSKAPGLGTGLGLPISREIVEAHGGALRLVDVEQGAVFEARLPVAKNGMARNRIAGERDA